MKNTVFYSILVCALVCGFVACHKISSDSNAPCTNCVAWEKAFIRMEAAATNAQEIARHSQEIARAYKALVEERK